MNGNKHIGFTCSTFDLLHAGHIAMLREAKEHCDYLMCGIQVDPSYDRPEKNAPVQTLVERWTQLQGVKYVDEIIPYETEEEWLALLNHLPVDIRIIGEDYYKKDFPHLRWRFLVFLMGNKSFFNALLYKGHFIEKNVEESHFEYYLNNFDHLINNILAKESFFLQLVFLGKVMTKEGIPIEADPSVFYEIKKSLNEGNAIVHLEQKDIFELVKKIDNIDFFSFSDVPSYFRGDIENNFLQNIKPCLSSNGIVVLRYYLRISEVNEDGYQDVTKDYYELIRKEKVGMYRIKILKNIS